MTKKEKYLNEVLKTDGKAVNEMGIGFVTGAGQDNAFYSGLGFDDNEADPAHRMTTGAPNRGYAQWNDGVKAMPSGSFANGITSGPGAGPAGPVMQDECEEECSDLEVLQDVKQATMELCKRHCQKSTSGYAAGSTGTCAPTSGFSNLLVNDFIRCFSQLEAKIQGWITESAKKKGHVVDEPAEEEEDAYTCPSCETTFRNTNGGGLSAKGKWGSGPCPICRHNPDEAPRPKNVQKTVLKKKVRS